MIFSINASAQEYSFSIEKYGIEKQTIIFIPGFASSGMVWNETVQELQKNNTCIVLTMAGFAGVVPEEEPSFEKWKVEIAKYIRDEHIEKPIVVGHSMGGALALALASDYPNLLSKIVVVDALPCLVALNNPNFESKIDNDCSTVVQQFKNIDEKTFVQMQRVSIASLTVNKQKMDTLLDWSLKSDRTTFAKMFCDFSNTDLRERIKKISIPTLVMLEPLFKNIEADIVQQYNNLSNVQLKYANQGLHFIMYDDPDWYYENLLEFISEN